MFFVSLLTVKSPAQVVFILNYVANGAVKLVTEKKVLFSDSPKREGGTLEVNWQATGIDWNVPIKGLSLSMEFLQPIDPAAVHAHPTPTNISSSLVTFGLSNLSAGEVRWS